MQCASFPAAIQAESSGTSGAFREPRRCRKCGRTFPDPVTVELPAGGCSLHHCLTLHNTKPNITENPRPGVAIGYMPVGTLDHDGNELRDHTLVRGTLAPVAAA